MNLPKAYHDSHDAHETNGKIQKVENISGLPEKLFQLADDVLDLGFAALYMSFFDTALLYLALTILLAHIHFDRVGDADHEPLQETRDDESRKLNRNIINGLKHRDLVANHGNLDVNFGQIDESVKRYTSANDDYLDKYYNINMLFNHIISLGEHICYFVFAFQCATGHWSPWRIYTCHTHWQTIRRSAFSLRAQAAVLQAQLISVRHVTELLDVVSSVPERDDAEELKFQQSTVRLTGVSFTYQGNKAGTEKASSVGVQNLTIDLEFGKVYALVGLSGNGKSTLLNLIARQYDVGEGSIFFGTQDVRGVTKRSLSRCVGLLRQNACILPHLDIKENVAYGRTMATEDEIVKACEAAMIHEVIRKLPQGYATVLKNEELSGGERQRIALARMLLEESKVLLLDEPTSALDPETETRVFSNILALRGSRTIVVVTHNLRHAVKADYVLVLDGGRLVEQGTHAELLREKDGKYANMWESQSGTPTA